jgi:uncharacterized protein
MMPDGPSPESGLAGVWRVIRAQPAPWVKPHKLNRAAAPLLEYAVEFRDREVKGPAPLGCATARYSSGVTYGDGLFGGRLANDKDGAMAAAVRLSRGSPTTFRVTCGTVTRDYYIDDNADMVMAEGDVIYTLERPTGMDPQQYKAGFSGPSFDCNQAKTAAEQLICSDAQLSKSDTKMAAAYLRLQREESAGSFATVQTAQRAWLAYVRKTCGDNAKMPDDLGDRNKLQECLSDNYSDRADRLDVLAALKSGTLVLEPRMRFFSRAMPATEDSDIYPWMEGGPEAAPFNAWIAKRLALGKRRLDDKNLFPFGHDVDDLKLYARRTYSVVRFDHRVVSLEVSTFDYGGGAHEAINESELNWDVAKGSSFGPADIFIKGKNWMKFATDYCLKDLHGQFADQQAPDPDRSAVEAVVRGENWLFAGDHATVHFTVYTISSFAGGEYDVDIPYTTLKPYLRSDAPVLIR